MDARLRSPRAETSTAAAIPTYTREDRQPQQAGLGGKGRARTWSEDDGSGRDIQTKVAGREGRNGEVSQHCLMRSQLDLTFRIKVTATMKFLITLCPQRVWISDSRVVTVSPLPQCVLTICLYSLPIPSIFFGVRRLQLVEIGRTCLY